MCGHSFCLRPCILDTEGITRIKCPICHANVDVRMIIQDKVKAERVEAELRRQMEHQLSSPYQPQWSSYTSYLTCPLCYLNTHEISTCLHCNNEICLACQMRHRESVSP